MDLDPLPELETIFSYGLACGNGRHFRHERSSAISHPILASVHTAHVKSGSDCMNDI